ncbi:Catenin-beta-like protein [Schizosaccharomyces pombe]|uniref:Beta-catenin-like protein 1 homolog n=1 Tax=Schizosaccharomyces pombe (strain 972 / ATCC 24843) TaxID=284812 RepID=CTBL1_SCHPO|nr:uncharacterized protein SPAC1952.06c [Schizosaccharomyces pombe]Q9UUK1.1 RecName: Full=Beta-catenin-like protein 1 homolog [Schizosaccharomyces pombe 972h-]CAB52570.1 DUF1716 family protein [Schizosaccharomyces pombe]|eukprot:NP_594808.1 uncharacterized protein SPAC1952.06c [Schizosaccharomyces pombe]
MDVDSIFKNTEETNKKRNPEEADSLEPASSRRRLAEENSDEENEEFDEEGGRFFGSGLKKSEKTVLDFLDEQEAQEEPASLTPTELKRMVVRLEKTINNNQELRIKYSTSPQRFIESEADLDLEIRSFNVLSEYPILIPIFLKLDCVSTFLELMNHENADITITVLELLIELTDEDVDPDALNSLFTSLIDSGLLPLLSNTIKRFDESNEEDRHGVYCVLSLMENLLSVDNSICSIIVENTTLVEWLLSRSSVDETSISTNLQYAVEILAIILANSKEAKLKVCNLNGIDLLLRRISPYRLRDPTQGSEEEMMENVFDCLCSLVQETKGKSLFLKEEGIELCILNMKHKGKSRYSTIKVLDYLLFGPLSTPYCIRFVEAGGLKYIFAAFMKISAADTLEHILAILASLFRSLPADTVERVRFLRKFIENDFEKMKRLFKIYDRLRIQLKGIDQSRKLDFSPDSEEKSTKWFLQQIDHGLFPFQSTVLILSWLCVENTVTLKKIKMLFSEASIPIDELTDALKNYHENLEEPTVESEEVEANDSYYRIDEKPMVTVLLGSMQASV